MATINNYSTLTNPQGGDLLAVFSSNNSDTRKFSLSALTTYLNTALDLSTKKDAFTTQYSAPNAEAFNVAITDGSDNIWAIITPTGGFTDMTITLPATANAVDKQEVVINCTQAITTLTIAGNGADAVTGAPSGLSANDFFKLKYDKPFNTWYRIG